MEEEIHWLWLMKEAGNLCLDRVSGSIGDSPEAPVVVGSAYQMQAPLGRGWVGRAKQKYGRETRVYPALTKWRPCFSVAFSSNRTVAAFGGSVVTAGGREGKCKLSRWGWLGGSGSHPIRSPT